MPIEVRLPIAWRASLSQPAHLCMARRLLLGEDGLHPRKLGHQRLDVRVGLAERCTVSFTRPVLLYMDRPYRGKK